VADDFGDQVDGDELDLEVEEGPVLDRDDELSTRKGVKSQLLDLYSDVEAGFVDQYQRTNDQMDYWDVYNCILGSKQFYSGNSKIFVPLVKDAVDARKTRFANQVFPPSGRYVDAISEDGTEPFATLSLLDHYVRKAKVRTEVMPALLVNGDVEGQYSIYVHWCKTKRSVVQRVKVPVEIDGLPTGDDIDDVDEQEIETGRPDVEVLADADLLVLPYTCDSLDEAIACGGSVTVLRRWTKAKIKQMARDGEITKTGAKALIEEMSDEDTGQAAGQPKTDKSAHMVDAAGIKSVRGTKHALVYETWSEITVRKGERRLCRTYFGGRDNILGCKRNPLWCDLLPILSAPVKKIQGSFKGRSLIEPVAPMQYMANDACNEAMDSAAYALMPIVMTDPNANPRVGSMILSLAAIWETSPKDTQFAQFPPLWKEGLEIVLGCKNQIKESLSVNSAMVTQQGTSKLNQAEIAQEQQVDLLTTADAVTVLEHGILTPMLNLFLALDHQHREDDIFIKQWGPMGTRAKLEKVEPITFDKRYEFIWFGVEQARSQQQIQMQIAIINVLRGIDPASYAPYKLNVRPAITHMVGSAFGPQLAPLTFESPEMQMPVMANQEDEMLSSGFEVPVHELDDDNLHIQSHMALLQADPKSDYALKIQAHIFTHIQQMNRKAMAVGMAQGPMAGGMPGVPGGAGPGVAGTPKPGAAPTAPRGTQQPPGAIHQDQLKDPSQMPRQMS
jgi:hypothetical protein